MSTAFNKLSDKRKAFVLKYCRNGFNASQAYKEAYPDSKVGWDGSGSRLLANVSIKQAISDISAENQEIVKHSFEEACKMLQQRIDYLQAQAEKGNIQAIQAQTALIRELNDISGLHKQRFVDETEQQRELTESEELEARRIASIRLRTG